MSEIELIKLLLANGGAGGAVGLGLSLLVVHFRLREIARDVQTQEEKFDERLEQMDSRLKTLENQTSAIQLSVAVLQTIAQNLDNALRELKELIRKH